jgi:SAM-dependent methyltransferase
MISLLSALRFLGLALILLALLSTALWLDSQQAVDVGSRSFEISLVQLCTTVALTSLNLLLRWFRWHFLLRRFGVRLRTRPSILVYFATLPAILTPFYLGELVRSFLFLRQEPALKPQILKVWLIERGTDVALLATACVWTWIGPGASLMTLIVIQFVLAGLLRSVRSASSQASSLSGALALATILLGATALSWSLPVLALWSTMNGLGDAVSFADSAYAFSASTLLSAASGIPGGIAVAGSAQIWLLKHGHSLQIATWTVAIFRLGTVWFSVALGAAVLWFGRSAIRANFSSTWRDHFNELASQYEGEIASHTREKLLQRKVAFMKRWLDEQPPDSVLSGLDLGCGPGWYAVEMAQGRRMIGLDASYGQLRKACEYGAGRAERPTFVLGSGAQLPFKTASFDFAYSINVLHHMLDDDIRRSCYAEIARVLKPGGMFFLHEMNTENPLFRLHMSYLFPLLNRIDEGNERWILPSALPEIAGAAWQREISYFTFLPEFVPRRLAQWLGPVERWLEQSQVFRRYSAHYMAVLVKTKTDPHREPP